MLRLAVVGHPGARAERVELVGFDPLPPVLHVWVRARPVAGQANVAIERVVANALGLRGREVRLVAGGTSRRKFVEIDLPDREDLIQRLEASGGHAD